MIVPTAVCVRELPVSLFEGTVYIFPVLVTWTPVRISKIERPTCKSMGKRRLWHDCPVSLSCLRFHVRSSPDPRQKNYMNLMPIVFVCADVFA